MMNPKSSGNSPPPTRESSYAICTHNFRVDGVVGWAPPTGKEMGHAHPTNESNGQTL
jgi:hypothetical protein